MWLQLPIHASLLNARYLGRKCILIDNSILRNVDAKLFSICAESGVETLNGASETPVKFIFNLLIKQNKPTSQYKKNLQVQLSSLLSKKIILTTDSTNTTNNDDEGDNMVAA